MQILEAFDSPHQIAIPEICQPSLLRASCKIVLFSADGLGFYCCVLWFGTVHNTGITVARVQAGFGNVLPRYEHANRS
jgi:hypothetical protein